MRCMRHVRKAAGSGPSAESTGEGPRACGVVSRRARLVAAALALLLAVATAALWPGPTARAFADGDPTNTLYFVSDASSLEVGDQFALSLVFERDGQSAFQMYAFSATLRWDTDALELVGYETDRLDAYVATQDSYADLVLNYLSSSLAGTTWESPATILTMTFQVRQSGTTKVAFRRANVANSTGMGRYASTCFDADVYVGDAGANAGSSGLGGGTITTVVPAETPSAGTTEAVAADENDVAQAPSAPALLTLTEEERAELEELGYDVDLLVESAVKSGVITEEEYADYVERRAAAGHPVAGSSASSSSSGSASSAGGAAGAGASGGSSSASGNAAGGVSGSGAAAGDPAGAGAGDASSSPSAGTVAAAVVGALALAALAVAVVRISRRKQG